jgi:hypothetical protein
MTGKLIDLDPNQLLGLSQVAQVSGAAAMPSAQLLTKAGPPIDGEAESPTLLPGVSAKLLSKIGETSVESDVRLKRDIEHLATRPDGLPIYAFKYHWDDEVHVGVMAQDLLQNELWRPAVLTKPNGYYAVDYGRLGLRMTTLDDWQARRMAALRLGN